MHALLWPLSRLHSRARVARELSEVGHAASTLAREWGEDGRPATRRDLARVASLVGRACLLIVAHGMMEGRAEE